MSPDTLNLPVMKPMVGSIWPVISATRFVREILIVQSASMSSFTTRLGEERPSSTTTPSSPQSNFRMAFRPLSSPIFWRIASVMAGRSMGEVSRGRFKVKRILEGILKGIHVPGNARRPVFAPMVRRRRAG